MKRFHWMFFVAGILVLLAGCEVRMPVGSNSGEIKQAAEGTVDNSTYLENAEYYRATYDQDGDVLEIMFGTIDEEGSKPFLKLIELQLQKQAKISGVALENDFMDHVKVEKITDESLIQKLEEME